jgi:hypothetical protein
MTTIAEKTVKITFNPEVRELRKLQRRVRTNFRRIEDLRMDLALCGLPGLCSMARDAKDALDRLDTALEERVHGI